MKDNTWLWENCIPIAYYITEDLHYTVSSRPEEDGGVIRVLDPRLLLCLFWNHAKDGVTLFNQLFQLPWIQSLLNHTRILFLLQHFKTEGVGSLIQPPEAGFRRKVDLDLTDDLLDLLHVHLPGIRNDRKACDPRGQLSWKSRVWGGVLAPLDIPWVAVYRKPKEGRVAARDEDSRSPSNGHRARNTPQHEHFVVDVVKAWVVRKVRALREIGEREQLYAEFLRMNWWVRMREKLTRSVRHCDHLTF